MTASWLPGKNGSAIIPSSGEILLPEITLDHLLTITQSEAFKSKSLYGSAELAGSFEESDRYRGSNPPKRESLSPFQSLWSMFGLHSGVSIVISIILALALPSLIKLVRRLFNKGEETLENHLHLTPTKNRRTKIWGRPE